MWTHMAYNWIMRKCLNTVMGVFMNQHWPSSWWFLSSATVRYYPPESWHLKPNILVPALLHKSVFVCARACDWPVTDPLVLVTAVGSEQKAAYFLSNSSAHHLLHHKHKEGVTWIIRSKFVFSRVTKDLFMPSLSEIVTTNFVFLIIGNC